MWHRDNYRGAHSAHHHAHLRPDIRCTFAAMRQCDAWYGRDTPRADQCRAGARDAHLLDAPTPTSWWSTWWQPWRWVHDHHGTNPPSSRGGDAYRAGRDATLRHCPVRFDDAATWHTHHGVYT